MDQRELVSRESIECRCPRADRSGHEQILTNHTVFHGLPEEVLLKIFQVVPKGALPNTILTCQDFRRISLPLLYADVALGDLDTVIAFCRRVIDGGEEVGLLVRSIRIFLRNGVPSPTSEVDFEARNTLIACLEMTTQLRSFACLVPGILTRLDLCLAVREIRSLEHLEFSLAHFDVHGPNDPELSGPATIVSSVPPANLKYLLIQDWRGSIFAAHNYDSFLTNVMSSPVLEQLVISAVSNRVDQLLSPFWAANISSSLRSITVPALSPNVMRILREFPHVQSLSTYEGGWSPAERHLRDQSPANPVQLETLRCSSKTLASCTSLFHGLAYIQLDGIAYPSPNTFFGSLGWAQVYCGVLIGEVLSSAAVHMRTLQYLSFVTRDEEVATFADIMPMFPVLKTCIVGITSRRIRASVGPLLVVGPVSN